MPEKMSFKEIVKKSMYNRIWREIKKYLSAATPESLNLSPTAIEDTDKLDLDNIDIKYVDAADLPGNRIKFAVVVEAYITVNDMLNNGSWKLQDWLVCDCTGKLTDTLSDTSINNIRPYTGKTKFEHPMSDSLIPIISKKQLDDIAEAFLQRFYGEALDKPVRIDPIKLARKMDLNIILQNITEDTSIFGQVFFSDSITSIYDKFNETETDINVPKGTVIVDPDVAIKRSAGAYTNTIIHECIHWILHKKTFALNGLSGANANRQVSYKVAITPQETDKDTMWMEWQANSLAPRIQMPIKTFKIKASETVRKYRKKLNPDEDCELMTKVIDELAEFYGVSKLAAKLRLIDAGYEGARGTYNYIDGHYVEPYKTTSGKMKKDETYSLPVHTIASLISNDTNLRKLVNTGAYLYVDSHLVANNKKYIEKDKEGHLTLTNYARNHIEKCCIVFQITTEGNNGQQIHYSYCMNRNKASQVNFTASYKYGEDDNGQAKSIAEYNMDILEIVQKLPCTFSGMLNCLQEWRGMSVEKLVEKSELSERTIRRYKKSEPECVPIETVIQLCIGLQLPPQLSFYLLNVSGNTLMKTEQHMMYYFLLTTCYNDSIFECDKKLYAQGLQLLGNESKKYFEKNRH